MQQNGCTQVRAEGAEEATAALRVLAAVLGAQGNPFLSCVRVVDHCVQLHLMHFAKLFHSTANQAPSPLCRLHLKVHLSTSLLLIPLHTARHSA